MATKDDGFAFSSKWNICRTDERKALLWTCSSSAYAESKQLVSRSSCEVTCRPIDDYLMTFSFVDRWRLNPSWFFIRKSLLSVAYANRFTERLAVISSTSECRACGLREFVRVTRQPLTAVNVRRLPPSSQMRHAIFRISIIRGVGSPDASEHGWYNSSAKVEHCRNRQLPAAPSAARCDRDAGRSK